MVDLQEIILDEIKRTRADLKDHIQQEDRRFDRIDDVLAKHTDDITDLKTSTSITKTQIGFFSAIVAAIVTGLMSWVSSWMPR
jgi:hypothetical protein